MDQRGAPAGEGTGTPEAGPEVDGIVVVGEEAEPPTPGRAKQNPGVVRADVQEIVNGTMSARVGATPSAGSCAVPRSLAPRHRRTSCTTRSTRVRRPAATQG
jgi:hypothetical protein